jgi:hypothetical protein
MSRNYSILPFCDRYSNGYANTLVNHFLSLLFYFLFLQQSSSLGSSTKARAKHDFNNFKIYKINQDKYKLMEHL